jgi:hypothetical protein
MNEMKKWALGCAVLCVVLTPAFALGEKTLRIGGEDGWKNLHIQEGITFLDGVRSTRIATLSSEERRKDGAADIYLSFDEGSSASFRDGAGNYTVRAGESILAAPKRWARRGGGAALFSGRRTAAYQTAGGEPLTITPQNPSALFAPGRNIGDFSIEFFLYPANMESGEEIFDWSATLRAASGTVNARRLQSIRALVAKNRLNWSFDNFFISPDGSKTKAVRISSKTPLAPGSWSHHLIRFDAATGMLEYLVDGAIEAIAYATASGREDGEAWPPLTGERGAFSIGRQFNGFIDEFKVISGFSTREDERRYAADGARLESAALDLGSFGSALRKIDVSGGVLQLSGKTPRNEYRRGGNFRFENGAEARFFVRSADSPLALEDTGYRPFTGGAELSSLKGRYVQVMAALYPSGDLESAPYIEEIKLEYVPKGAPAAPARLTAAARDGAVELSWKDPADGRGSGYLVYYGTKQGEYFGEESALGASPIDVGKSGHARLENLKNGTLYYFAVAAYDDAGPAHPGNISKEVSARPLRMLE